MSHPLVGRIVFNDRRTEKPRVLEAPYKLDGGTYVEFGSETGLWGYANTLREGPKPCPTFASPYPEMEAMQIVLELLRRGMARFDVSPNGFSEFCFKGMRYYFDKDDSYENLVARIGGLTSLRVLLEVK